MQSDTVIGIVGAVVLVAVMVGVFAYEYNNAPEPEDEGPDPSTDAGKMEIFNTTYPSLVAEEDIDDDDVPNWDDDDLDDDGMNNTVDDDGLNVTFDVSGQVGARDDPQDTPSTTKTFLVQSGNAGYDVVVTHTVQLNPVTNAPVDTMQVTLTNPAGSETACQPERSGTTMTCTFTANSNAAVGEYTLTVTDQTSIPSTSGRSFQGSALVLY